MLSCPRSCRLLSIGKAGCYNGPSARRRVSRRDLAARGRDRLQQDGRALRTRDRDASVENEAGHALYSGVDGFATLVGHDVAQRVGGEHFACFLCVPSAFGRKSSELVDVANGAALDEECTEELLDQIACIALRLRPCDEP